MDDKYLDVFKTLAELKPIMNELQVPEKLCEEARALDASADSLYSLARAHERENAELLAKYEDTMHRLRVQATADPDVRKAISDAVTTDFLDMGSDIRNDLTRLVLEPGEDSDE